MRRMYDSLTDDEKKKIYNSYVKEQNSIDRTCRETGMSYGMVYKYLSLNNFLRPREVAHKLLRKEGNK